jgi:hypothetical protein
MVGTTGTFGTFRVKEAAVSGKIPALGLLLCFRDLGTPGKVSTYGTVGTSSTSGANSSTLGVTDTMGTSGTSGIESSKLGVTDTLAVSGVSITFDTSGTSGTFGTFALAGDISHNFSSSSKKKYNDRFGPAESKSESSSMSDAPSKSKSVYSPSSISLKGHSLPIGHRGRHQSQS